MSCSSAASRTRSSGTRVGDDRDRVREHVLVPVDRILLELHRVELGQELVGEAGPCEEPEARLRIGCDEQLAELVADPFRARRSRGVRGAAAIASTISGSGSSSSDDDEPRRAQHAQRIVEERHLDRERACATGGPRDRPRPPNGSTNSSCGSASAMALTVKSRRERSVSMSSPKTTSGLRLSGQVDVGAERRDLEAQPVALRADGAEAPALEPQVLGPAVEHAPRWRRGARRWRGRCRCLRGRDRRPRRAATRRRGRAIARHRSKRAASCSSGASSCRYAARDAGAAGRSPPDSRGWSADSQRSLTPPGSEPGRVRRLRLPRACAAR